MVFFLRRCRVVEEMGDVLRGWHVGGEGGDSSGADASPDKMKQDCSGRRAFALPSNHVLGGGNNPLPSTCVFKLLRADSFGDSPTRCFWCQRLSWDRLSNVTVAAVRLWSDTVEIVRFFCYSISISYVVVLQILLMQIPLGNCPFGMGTCSTKTATDCSACAVQEYPALRL